MAMVQGKPKEQQKTKNNLSVFMQRIGKSNFKPNEAEPVQSAPQAQTIHQQFSTFWQKNVSNNKKQDQLVSQSPTPNRLQMPRRNTIATKEDRQFIQGQSDRKGGTVRQETSQSVISKSTMPKVKHESMECLSSIDENRGFKPSDTKDPKTAEFLTQLYKNIFMKTHIKKNISKSWESSNQESNTGSSLLDKIMTPAPQEQHSGSLKKSDPRKMFTDSSFYSAEHHPSVAEQLEMAHRLSSALFNEDSQSSKGRQMYLKRAKLTGETIDEDDPGPRHDKVPNLKLVMNPHGKVQEWSDMAPEDFHKKPAVVTHSKVPTPSLHVETEAGKSETSMSRPSTFLSAYREIFDQNRGVFGNTRQNIDTAQVETPPLRHKMIQPKSVSSVTPALQIAEKQIKSNKPVLKLPTLQVKLPTKEVDKVDIVLKTPALLAKEPSRLEQKEPVRSATPTVRDTPIIRDTQKEPVRSVNPTIRDMVTPTIRDTEKKLVNMKPVVKSPSPQIKVSSKEADKIDIVLKTPALLPPEISKLEPMAYKNIRRFPHINSTSAVAKTKALFEDVDADKSKNFNPIKKSKTFSSFPVDNRRENFEVTPTVPVRDSSKKYLAPYKSINENMNNINNLNECSFEKSRNSNLNNVNRVNDNSITKSLNSNLNNIYNYNNTSCANSHSSNRRIPLQNFFI